MIVALTERRSSPTSRAVKTIVTLVARTVYEFFSLQVYSPFMYLLFMIPLVLGVVLNLIAKMTRKTFLESEGTQASYKMGPHLHLRQLPQRSLRHLRTSSVYPTFYLPVGVVLLVVVLGLEPYYKKAVAK